ncbi:MAG: hypothetical protein R3C52_10970 [Hyphomonadaceae bacterium]
MRNLVAPAAAALAVMAAIAGASMSKRDVAEPDPVLLGTALGAPEPAPSSPPPGGTSVQPQLNQGVAGPVNAGAEIVVKFKNDAMVKDIIDTFWRDEGAASAKFETFKAGHPEFAGLKLDRVTYSNELVLTPSASIPPARRLTVMREMAARLTAGGAVSYAEPNLMAQPGER